MAPPRSRPPPDDSRSEASSTKEKVPTSNSTALNGKNRRVPGSTTGGSSLRDVVTAGSSSAAVGTTNTTMTDANPAVSKSPPATRRPYSWLTLSLQLQWSSFDASILHGYRHDYRLNTPAAFNKPYNQLILSRSAIGRMSPTMARRKEQRRQSKEQLANSVRKHFNSMGIIENEVVVDFLYKVRWQGKWD
jgi:hypothetical protein